MTSTEKQARSEALRLESLRRKREEDKKRNELISNSLKSIDQPTKSRIVFEDSDSDEDVQGSIKNTSSGKPQLFDKSDAEDEEDVDFVLPTRLDGRKGEKLMKLETKFEDSRFKLDNKFVSSDSESDEEEESDELSKETSKNRELLAKVLGKSVKAAPSSKSINGLPSRPFTRFDPDNKDHVNWMKRYGGAEKTKDESSSSEDENNQVNEEDAQKIVAGNFFEIDSAFANELRLKQSSGEQESNGFSFLAMMGRTSQGETKLVPTGMEEDIKQPDRKTLRILGKLPEESTIPEYQESDKSFAPAKVSSFFLTGKESHVQSVVTNFRLTQSEKTFGLWSNYRDSIMKIYRHQKKVARKQLRAQHPKLRNGKTKGKNDVKSE